MTTALRWLLVFAAAALSGATTASAQSPASREPATTFSELSSLLAPGATLVVTDAQGRKVTGKLTGLSAESLSLAVSGQVETYAPQDVQEVRHKRSDSKLNGALIGFAAGFGVPALTCRSRTDEVEICGAIALVVGGPLGFVIGMGVDAMIVKKVTVFRAETSPSSQVTLAPVIGPGRIGLRASIRLGAGRSGRVD